jgi:hypothetical protein
MIRTRQLKHAPSSRLSVADVMRHMKTDLIIEMIGVGLDNQKISRKGEVLLVGPPVRDSWLGTTIQAAMDVP